MLGSIFASAIPFHENNNGQDIVLQCVEMEASKPMLKQSAEIISKRLKSVGINNATVEISTDRAAIGISFKGKVELDNAGWLLSSKGELGFYETADREEVIEMLQNEDALLHLLDVSSNCHQSLNAVLGCCRKSEMTEVTEILHVIRNQKLSDANIQFAWGASSVEDHQFQLYLLKGYSAINGSNVDKARVVDNKSSGKSYVLIDFDQIGGMEFHDLSKRNISKSVAIVLDDVVYAAPVVQQAISGGKCMISGKFSENELAQLAAIINNGELPLDFKLAN